MARELSAMEQAMEELKDLREDPDFFDYVIRREIAIIDEISFRAAAEKKGRQEGLEKGRQEGIQKGLQEGLQKGLQEGRAEGEKKLEQMRKETCKRLFDTNMSITDIAKIVDLPEDLVLEIKKEIETQ